MSNKNMKTLNLDDVNLARQQALRDGKKPTVSLIHNTIGGNTGAIGALLSELADRDDRARAAFDLPDEFLIAGLSSLNQMWSEALAQNGAELSGARAQLEALSADRAALQTQLEMHIAENAQLSDERHSLAERLAEADQKLASLEALEAKMGEMQARHDEAMSEAAARIQAAETGFEAAKATWTERERSLMARVEEAQKTAERYRVQFESFAHRVLDRVGPLAEAG
ncbi:DNA-binding protein [Donghicola tyrosinivorans]|uniref:Plasmid replication DNA-binding protein KfrA n=1 Tax=Donghicola tyrosinivorans TaxID=1652492 RepID=A0A2T0W8B3_9RHOB|nr:DNA-binding protein [Donghicola tyrosinivorans]PRY82925.1 plasmid replication DNA-binding protein KfrA [Donghicola tyrosinivorans]